MSLEELLEELRENILRDVSDEVGHSQDSYLLDDRSLVRYIEEGVVKFAVGTLCIRDETTPDVTRIRLSPGVDSYALDPRVIAVFGARVGHVNLRRTTYSGMTSGADVAYSTSIEDWGRQQTNCAPRWFYTDRESGKLGVWPVPGEDVVGVDLILRVARKPLRKLEATDLKAEPEIPDEYHLDILEWAAWRALRNHDADLEALAKASQHRKRFEETVGELSKQSKRLLAQDVQFRVNANWR